MTETTTIPALTVYYDGACPICRFEIGHYQQCAGSEAIDFVNVAAENVPSLGDGLDRDKAMARFHVRRADGSLVSGAAGFSEVWRVLPGWRKLGRIASLPFILPILEFGYKAILPVRARLSALLLRFSQG